MRTFTLCCMAALSLLLSNVKAQTFEYAPPNLTNECKYIFETQNGNFNIFGSQKALSNNLNNLNTRTTLDKYGTSHTNLNIPAIFGYISGITKITDSTYLAILIHDSCDSWGGQIIEVHENGLIVWYRPYAIGQPLYEPSNLKAATDTFSIFSKGKKVYKVVHGVNGNSPLLTNFNDTIVDIAFHQDHVFVLLDESIIKFEINDPSVQQTIVLPVSSSKQIDVGLDDKITVLLDSRLVQLDNNFQISNSIDLSAIGSFDQFTLDENSYWLRGKQHNSGKDVLIELDEDLSLIQTLFIGKGQNLYKDMLVTENQIVLVGEQPFGRFPFSLLYDEVNGYSSYSRGIVQAFEKNGAAAALETDIAISKVQVFQQSSSDSVECNYNYFDGYQTIDLNYASIFISFTNLGTRTIESLTLGTRNHTCRVYPCERYTDEYITLNGLNLQAGESFTHHIQDFKIYDLPVYDDYKLCFWVNPFGTHIDANPDNNFLCEGETLVITNTNTPVTPELRLFPNPAGDWLELQLPEGFATTTAQLQIFNLQGQSVRKQELNSTTVSIEDLAKGGYFLTVQNGGQMYSGKFVKL